MVVKRKGGGKGICEVCGKGKGKGKDSGSHSYGAIYEVESVTQGRELNMHSTPCKV